ncbi:MAG: PAS domain S-box protein [Bacteroidetes bacterium]|nr:PAS domain S-box protein [Bacteroidota bacterium]
MGFDINQPGRRLTIFMKQPHTGYPNYAADNGIAPASYHKFKILADHSDCAFLVLDANNTVTECNAAALVMFEYTAAEFTSVKKKQIIEQTAPAVVAEINTKHKGHHTVAEVTGIKKNGQRFPVELFTAFFIDSDGTKKSSCVIRNIGEEKKVPYELHEMFNSIKGGFFTVDSSWIIKFWNKEAEKITGLPAGKTVGKEFWQFLSLNKYSVSSVERYKTAMAERKRDQYEILFDPTNCWLEVNIFPFDNGLSVFFKDITETRRLRILERIEKELLENNTRTGSNLQTALSYYLQEIEQIHSGMICSVLQHKNNKLYNWASPSLPATYCEIIEGINIGDNVGSCGTAAFKKEKVIVSDIEHDTRWAGFKDAALAAGLRSCWSFPVLNVQHEVIATFAIYYKEVKTPTKEEERTIERARNILTIILEKKIAEEQLQITLESYRSLFNSNPLSIIIWDMTALNILEVNEAASRLYGYHHEEFIGRPITDIYEPDELVVFAQLVKQLRKNKPSKKAMRWRHTSKSNERIVTEVSLHQIIYDDKKAVLTLCNDVTEKVLLENSLIEERKIRQKQITDAVITGQEKERVEIGQELHDNINQILATSKLYLECAIAQNHFRPHLINESKALTEKAMTEIRRLSKNLLPPSLDEVGLMEALNDLIKNIRSVNALKISTNWKNFDESPLNVKLKLTIFRIVQEQLNNIIKHAQAKHTVISIAKTENQLLLNIKDDGVGFDAAGKRNGVGLKNIISRSEVNNGKVCIQSAPGKGCTLSVCFAI